MWKAGIVRDSLMQCPSGPARMLRATWRAAHGERHATVWNDGRGLRHFLQQVGDLCDYHQPTWRPLMNKLG